MPDLGAKVTAAVSADQVGRKNAVAAVAASDVFPVLQLTLHQFPLGGVNDGRVAVLHIVLRRLDLVFLLLLGEKIHREYLLQESIAIVLLVFENALHRTCPPLFLSGEGEYPFPGEVTRLSYR